MRIWAVLINTAIALTVKMVFPIRVDAEDEASGFNITSHGERAYDMSSSDGVKQSNRALRSVAAPFIVCKAQIYP